MLIAQKELSVKSESMEKINDLVLAQELQPVCSLRRRKTTASGQLNPNIFHKKPLLTSVDKTAIKFVDDVTTEGDERSLLIPKT